MVDTVMNNWAVGVLLECSNADDFEELTCLEFYGALFSRSKAYQRYQRNMSIPVTLSEEPVEGHDEPGTWRPYALNQIPEVVSGRTDCYISGCTYFPKKRNRFDGKPYYESTNSLKTASELCAFIVDIDHVRPGVFKTLLEEIWPMNGLPCPTYITTSGNGVHLYYVLDWPVDMLKRWRTELEHIDNWLGSLYEGKNPTFTHVSGFDTDKPEFTAIDTCLGVFDKHGLTQPFRVVGSLAKNGNDVVSAWRVGSTWELEELRAMSGLEQPFSVDEFDMTESLKTQAWKASKARSEAAAANQKKGSKNKGHNPVFYPWFVEEAKRRAKYASAYGSRFNVAMCCVIAAQKDNRSPRQKKPITYDQVVSDVRELYELWTEARNHAYIPFPITWSECKKAIRCGYQFKGKGPTWQWISSDDMCNWEHKVDKTHKLGEYTQEEWLEELVELKRRRKKRALSKGKTDWRGRGGRPTGSGTKQNLIQSYAREHPEANHSQIAKALGISRPTVIKWLKNTVD